MDNNSILNNFFENSKEIIEENLDENKIKMDKIRKELLNKFNEYKMTMKFMAADAPISILCLPKGIEKILSDQGFLRIYDLFDVDFVKIKGLGETRIRYLTTCLDQFFSML